MGKHEANSESRGGQELFTDRQALEGGVNRAVCSAKELSSHVFIFISQRSKEHSVSPAFPTLPQICVLQGLCLS